MKREHESAIASLEKLKSPEYRQYLDVDQGLVNNKIIQANKKIAYLDQPGKHSYWEEDRYGFQWFDKADGQFKIFFAHSKKCRKPTVVFGLKSEENGQIQKRHTLKPSSELSTLYVPFLLDGEQWITPPSVKCS